MKAGAFINLDGRPLDGLRIKWPENAGDFPVVIDFGFMLPAEDGKVLTSPQTLQCHRYAGVNCFSCGPELQDGMRAHEHADYVYEGIRHETSPSVTEAWDSVDLARDKIAAEDGDIDDAMRELDEDIDSRDENEDE